jgi:hypothetical protein
MIDLFINIEGKEYKIAEKKDVLMLTLNSSFIAYTSLLKYCCQIKGGRL